MSERMNKERKKRTEKNEIKMKNSRSAPFYVLK